MVLALPPNNQTKKQQQQEPERQAHLQQEAAATHVPITLVVSDSMCAGIRNAPLNEMLNAHSISPDSERVHVEKHLGATAEQLRYYSKYNIQLLKPDTVVVVAGANDVSNELSKPDPDHQQIANRIVEIARDAKQLGVAQVHILGIVNRRDKRYATLISRTNIALRLLSVSEGFHYVNNELIMSKDLQKDGLHVNFQGKKKLMHNILSCCASYNPAYGYMWNHLNAWGVRLN